MFDTVIKSGQIVDGSGQAARSGDIAIRDGRIVEVGGRISGAAREIIDADGALVTPGFVDLHSHYDGQVTWDDRIEPSFSNGVTSVVVGNCGVGFAPARAEHREPLLEMMEGVEAIPGVVLREGLTWTWETFPEYLDHLAAREYTMDVGVLIPHAPIRVYAMGERGLRHELATADDLTTMSRLVEEGVRAGALGFSSGRLPGHVSSRGDHIPGTFAAHEEYMELGRAMQRAGRGIFQFVPLGATGNFGGTEAVDRATRLEEHRLFVDIAEATGRPVHYSLTQIDNDPEEWRAMLGATTAAAERGIPVRAQVSSRGVGMISCLDGCHNFLLRPSYLKIAHLPVAERAEAMRQPDLRRAIIDEADVSREQAPRDWVMTKLLHGLMPTGFLMRLPIDYEPTADQEIGRLAAARGISVEELVYDHLISDGGNSPILHFFFNYANRNIDHIAEMLGNPYALSSLADGGAHMRFISDVSMFPFQLTFWTRDRKRGPKFPIEAMVRKITRDNAEAYGLRDRGVLAPGMRADINIIDFDNLKLSLPKIVHDLPAGGARLDQPSSGFLATLVNGTVTRRNDRDTGARPGRLIRSFAPSSES